MYMGSESEFGILDGWANDAAIAIQREVERRNLHLKGMDDGIFLENGARVYVDHGAHNEYCTPEANDPLLVTRYELAGRELLQEAAAACGHTLLCCNLHYGSGNTWGTHENYACRARPDSASRAVLCTHLASRIVFTGGGGPAPGRLRPRLVLSPRATVTYWEHAHQGLLHKSMIFEKPKEYGGGHRLHVMCGESLLSPRASWLKYGTTALVAQCLDLGVLDVEALAARRPLRALHVFNHDIDLATRVPMADGGCLGALDIQRRLADAVAGQRSALPAWADDVLVSWHELLDALTARDPRLSGWVDWVLFLRLWGQLAVEYGFDPGQQESPVAETPRDSPCESGSELERALAAAGRELYVRLHSLGANAPLALAAERGWLAPPLRGLEPADVRRARTEAPPGRAAARGHLVREFSGRAEFAVNWDQVANYQDHTSAWLPDEQVPISAIPWASAWINVYLPRAEAEDETRLLTLLSEDRTATTFDDCFWAGDYRGALSCAATAGGTAEAVDRSILALCHGRLGDIAATDRALAELGTENEHPFERTSLELFCAVNLGLAPPLSRCLPLIRQGEQLLEEYDGSRRDAFYHRAVFDQCRGRVRLYQGRLLEALSHLRSTVEPLGFAWRPRMLGRTQCVLADAHWRRGESEEARRALTLAGRIYITTGLVGDVADHLVPVRAKLGDKDFAEIILATAAAQVRRRGNGLSLARILCLSARVRGDADDEPELRDLLGRVEALRHCPLANRIIDNWAAWVRGDPYGDLGEYWGL